MQHPWLLLPSLLPSTDINKRFDSPQCPRSTCLGSILAAQETCKCTCLNTSVDEQVTLYKSSVQAGGEEVQEEGQVTWEWGGVWGHRWCIGHGEDGRHAGSLFLTTLAVECTALALDKDEVLRNVPPPPPPLSLSLPPLPLSL